MKIRSVSINARRKAFRVDLPSLVLFFPFVKADPAASAANPVVACRVDPEIEDDGLTAYLLSGNTRSTFANGWETTCTGR